MVISGSTFIDWRFSWKSPYLISSSRRPMPRVDVSVPGILVDGCANARAN